MMTIVDKSDERMTDQQRAIVRKAEYHCGAFDVPSLTAQEFIALREADDASVIVVDVRTDAERSVSQLPRSLSRCDFEQRLNADSPSLRDATVVVYCTVGRRSGAYAASLIWRNCCCERVFNSQGIVAYSHHALARGDGPHALVDAVGRPATRVHVYAWPWDLCSGRFESVRFGPLGAAWAAMFG